jgi:hypothetical protein
VASTAAFYGKGSDVVSIKTSKDVAKISKSPHLWIVELYREVVYVVFGFCPTCVSIFKLTKDRSP